MGRDKLIIKKNKKHEELIEWLETECQSPETADLSHSFAENLMIKLAEISYIESELSALEKEVPEEKPEKYVPYFGWCDVSRCKNEGCSGGVAWKETGYWTVCTKHAASCRNGDVQPKMKQSAIKREKSRDKVTGYL